MNDVDQKPHWSVRARNFGHQLTEFLADHGTHLGMAGGTVLAIAGTATLVSAGLAQSTQGVEATHAASTAMYIGAFVNMVIGATSEFIANQKLSGYENLFDQSENGANFEPRSDKRGATVIEDALLQSPDFRAAMLAVTQQLQDSPETRSGITEILRNHPGARQVLVELQRETAQTRHDQQQNKTEMGHGSPDDDLDGPGVQ